MIPYDDLVIALATWRARQGLPVAQLSGALTPPPPAPAAAAPPPRSAPPVAPPGRSGPPAAPPRPQSGASSAYFGNIETPPPLAAPDDAVDVDDAALLEEAHYENEGGDFAMAFGGVQVEGESTAIGVPPPARPSDTFGGGATMPEPEPAPPKPPSKKKKSSKKNDDW